MKFLYYVRVLLVSFEFLIVVFMAAIYLAFNDQIDTLILSGSPNEKAVDWLILYPMAVGAWVLNEARNVLFPTGGADSVLHQWEGYWRLKAHYNVGLFYCLFPIVPCVLVWLFNSIFTSWGITLFFACVVVVSVSAISFYQANVRLRELLINVSQG
ncbi:hypothetical protein [Pseudomonas sp. Q1-7]|uniref:hypothetical protein n=1 Tax=Pseudomonas sp. Q1-7 TaxID=3020843 RepID=UPI0022FFDEA3|nr:hypothetical protein [Pseudomonas sp. Q1-7]